MKAFPAGRAFATRFPAEEAGRAQTMAQSLTQIFEAFSTSI